MKFLFILAFSILSANASDNDITHRPVSFAYKSGKATFVDFEEAIYDITYDIDLKKSEVVAKFKMHIVEEGYPLFDLVEDPTYVALDGIETNTTVISTPANETKLRVINKVLPTGKYELTVKVPLKNLIEYTSNGVKSAFWVTDLEDRYYLERYIPVNLEYDRLKMTFNIQFNGLKAKQHIFANGTVNWVTGQKAKIEFPEHFTVNSLYFHTTPVGSVELLETSFKSVSGQDLPVSIYQSAEDSDSEGLKGLKTLALRVFNELEADYGAFPHASITIYNASLAHMGLGGMEYAGATVTNRGSLSHELFHSYFARGVTPANGNAGWIDEALASWRDNGYNRLGSLYGSSQMAAHPTYTRKTDTAAYSFGARFMAFLDNKFKDQGGLKPFMNKLIEKKLFEPLFTEEFIKEMETFYGEDLQGIFKTYVFKKSAQGGLKAQKTEVHRKLSFQELKSIL
jgi:hypothetical protein